MYAYYTQKYNIPRQNFSCRLKNTSFHVITKIQGNGGAFLIIQNVSLKNGCNDNMHWGSAECHTLALEGHQFKVHREKFRGIILKQAMTTSTPTPIIFILSPLGYCKT
jgi:hypothetical protein